MTERDFSLEFELFSGKIESLLRTVSSLRLEDINLPNDQLMSFLKKGGLKKLDIKIFFRELEKK